MYIFFKYSAVLLFLFFFFLMIRRPPRSTLFPYNDALPILPTSSRPAPTPSASGARWSGASVTKRPRDRHPRPRSRRSEEHTSELQSQSNLVCRLLLEKKKNDIIYRRHSIYNLLDTQAVRSD